MNRKESGIRGSSACDPSCLHAGAGIQRKVADGKPVFRPDMAHLLLICLLLLSTLAWSTPSRAEHTTYYVTNAQGTVVAEMDSSSTVTYEATYRPYGQQQNGAPQAGPGYTGHVNDPDTGLVYMQARYYDPAVGRFLSVDPLPPYSGGIFSTNRYAYVLDNPVVSTDPTGMCGTGGGEVSQSVQDLRNTSDGCSGYSTRNESQQSDSNYGKSQNSGGGNVNNSNNSGVHGGGGNTGNESYVLSYKKLNNSSSYDESRPFVVQWILNKKSKLGGWIVQQVMIISRGGNKNKEFWEAWPVPAGSKYTFYFVSRHDPMDDSFSPDPTVQVHATARYYEGLILPSTFIPYNPDTYAHMLPSTTQNPQLPLMHASSPVIRNYPNPPMLIPPYKF